MDAAVLPNSEVIVEFLGMPFYDDDIFKLLWRYLINFVVLAVIVRLIYYRHAHSKDYLFTYFMINTMVFFICFTLKKFELGLGMALGLFAIFGILRYRTSQIPIREMTYLFMVIGVGVINALANEKMSYVELAFTDLCIICLATALEHSPLMKRELRGRILYEKIDLIRPERHAELVGDLQERTGLKLSRLELRKIDFLRDTAAIDVFYHPHEQEPPRVKGVEVTLKTQRY